MQRILSVLVLPTFFCICAAAQSTPKCFYQTAINNFSNSYLGNDQTHQNIAEPQSTEALSDFVSFGRNGFILDGPVFSVGNRCTTSHLTLDVYSPDTYKQHCICSGGSAPGQGCTVINSDGLGVAGSCPGGGTATMYDNKYDVGLYCVGGDCTFGHLYAYLGPTGYSRFPKGQVNLHWAGGSVTLPTGNYAVGMGTNCDSGSIAGQSGIVSVPTMGTTVNWVSGPYFPTDGSWNNTYIYIGDPTYKHTISSVTSQTSLTLTSSINRTNGNVAYVQGATSGTGGGNCVQAQGEGDVYGAGGSGSGWVGATQLMSFKGFTTGLDPANSSIHADCLLFDPYHDNTIGLPGESSSFASTLAAYDSGGCSYVNNATTGVNPLTPFGQAPHMIDFAIW